MSDGHAAVIVFFVGEREVTMTFKEGIMRVNVRSIAMPARLQQAKLYSGFTACLEVMETAGDQHA